MKINWFKIKKKHIIDFIINGTLFIRGNPYGFSILLKYLKQGKICKDCEEDYEFCKCDYCNKCHYHFCLCNLNISEFKTYIKDYDERERNLIRFKCFKLLKYIMNKKKLTKLKNSMTYTEFPKYLISYASDNEIKYIESLIERLNK